MSYQVSLLFPSYLPLTVSKAQEDSVIFDTRLETENHALTLPSGEVAFGIWQLDDDNEEISLIAIVYDHQIFSRPVASPRLIDSVIDLYHAIAEKDYLE